MTEEQLRDELARLIDPDGWKLRDHGALPLDHPGAQAVVRRSRDTAQVIVDHFQLEVEEAPGGVSDFSPFTGKPVVQPTRWSVVGQRWFDAEESND